MPKEYVNSTEFFPETDEFVAAQPRFRVSWARWPTGQVQVASVADDAPPPTGTGDEGWYVTLDRDGVNQLIRHLRRARDQAYGRDE